VKAVIPAMDKESTRDGKVVGYKDRKKLRITVRGKQYVKVWCRALRN
jgi:hypothetical protein